MLVLFLQQGGEPLPSWSFIYPQWYTMCLFSFSWRAWPKTTNHRSTKTKKTSLDQQQPQKSLKLVSLFFSSHFLSCQKRAPPTANHPPKHLSLGGDSEEHNSFSPTPTLIPYFQQGGTTKLVISSTFLHGMIFFIFLTREIKNNNGRGSSSTTTTHCYRWNNSKNVPNIFKPNFLLFRERDPHT